jgi:Cu+-exporting ATPase
MLTGDNDATAKAVANKLNIKEVISNATPKDKLDKIKELGKTLMIGDGINDSPALKTATIGVSVSNGSDISADSSDVVLLTDNMNNIVDIFNIGNKTMRIIKQNLFWALFYNVCMIPLATGLLPISLNPMIASLAMTLSSFTVVVNSLRLL